MRSVLAEPLKLTLSVTDRCPLDCAHCYGDCNRPRAEPELSTEAWRRVIDDAADAGVMALFVEGGEPLLRDDLLDLIAHASDRMMVWLRTHALDVDDARARRIEAAGVGTVCVDLYGATAATHDAHAGTPGAFARTLKGILALRGAGLPVVPLTILTRDNLGELQGVADLAADLRLARVGVLRLYPLGRARRAWGRLAPSREETAAALAAVRPRRGVRLMQSWHPRNANCCWENAAVMSRGESVGCPYLRDFADFGNAAETSLMETWTHPLAARLRDHGRVRGACPDCEAREGSRGGCRATAYAFTGDWDAPDPFCPPRGPGPGMDLHVLPARLL